MTQQGDAILQDVAHIHWSFPEAIAANSERSLATSDLAMDYFAFSPFWDSKSNNNVLRTQRRIENPNYGHALEKIELNAFKSGFEFIVAHSQPPKLFVIHRREVDPNGKRDRVTGVWFILDDKIYQSPTLFDVMSTRLKNASMLIASTLSTLSEKRPPANPRSTTIWRAALPSAQKVKEPSRGDSSEVMEEDAQEGDDVEDLASGFKQEAVNTSNSQAPDWHLFHALQSTHSSLAYLDELSHAAVQPPDPREELENMEVTLIGLLGPQGSQRTQGPQLFHAKAGSARSASLQPIRKLGGVGVAAMTPQVWAATTPMTGGSPAPQ